MKRRQFITMLGGAAAWPVAARAQQPAMPVIGSLVAVTPAEWAPRMDGMRRGLSEAGYVEGRNVAIEYRWAEGHFDRLPKLATDLVGQKVALIFAGGSVIAIRAAITATKTIPIVFSTAGDPVTSGLVVSLNRPGGNVTGVTNLGNDLGPKQLELLREMIPTAIKIGLLVNPNNQIISQSNIRDAQAAARRLGLEIIVLNGGSETEIEGAFAQAVQQQAAALQISAEAFLDSRRDQIASLALRHGLPTINWDRTAVVAGELMSYGADVQEGYRQAGIYVGRILKGEKPVNLPVIQPTKFEMVINLKTAKALGLTIPESFLLRADEVIE